MHEDDLKSYKAAITRLKGARDILDSLFEVDDSMAYKAHMEGAVFELECARQILQEKVDKATGTVVKEKERY